MPEITPDLTGFVRRANADPGSILPRVDGESVSNWSARAVLATLDRDGTLYSRIETALAAEVDADEYTPVSAAFAAYRAVLPVVADYDIQRREAEDDRDRARDAERMAMDVRLAVEKILDGALGTEEDDGAGSGLAADVALVVQQRDRARDAAVALEQEIAAVRALHRPIDKTLDDDESTKVTVCRDCDGLRESCSDEAEPEPWPCATIRAMDAGETS